jgi:hypothetical protein
VSDLQCPARFLVVAGADAITAEELRHERVASVYDGQRGPGDVRAAAELARALDLPVQDLARSLSLADVLAHEALAIDALRDLADLHRGETVVVTATGGQGARVDVAVDGDGTTVVEVSRGAAR